MSHGDLYEKAKETIDALYSDASVSLEMIRSSLEALIAYTISKVHELDADEGAWVEGPDQGWGRFIPHKCAGCGARFRVWEADGFDRPCPKCGRRASEQETPDAPE